MILRFKIVFKIDLTNYGFRNLFYNLIVLRSFLPYIIPTHTQWQYNDNDTVIKCYIE